MLTSIAEVIRSHLLKGVGHFTFWEAFFSGPNQVKPMYLHDQLIFRSDECSCAHHSSISSVPTLQAHMTKSGAVKMLLRYNGICARHKTNCKIRPCAGSWSHAQG